MIRGAIVDKDGNVITAVVLAENWQVPGQPSYWEPPAGTTVVYSDVAGKGWKYDGKGFISPPEGDDTAPTPQPDPAMEKIDAILDKLVQKGVLSSVDASTINGA